MTRSVTFSEFYYAAKDQLNNYEYATKITTGASGQDVYNIIYKKLDQLFLQTFPNYREYIECIGRYQSEYTWTPNRWENTKLIHRSLIFAGKDIVFSNQMEHKKT